MDGCMDRWTGSNDQLSESYIDFLRHLFISFHLNVFNGNSLYHVILWVFYCPSVEYVLYSVTWICCVYGLLGLTFCSPVGGYQNFRGICCLCLQGMVSKPQRLQSKILLPWKSQISHMNYEFLFRSLYPYFTFLWL
jgi:hypothetical protein